MKHFSSLNMRTAKKHLIAIISTVALNIVLIILLIHLQALSNTTRVLQSPEVLIAHQPDAPLLISIDDINVAEPLSPQVSYKVQNVSIKPIRAYTVLEETVTSRGRGTGATIINLSNDEKVMHPTQAKQGTFGGQTFPTPLLRLTLSIDYAEFVDGTTWGKDTQHAAENLAGQRAGAIETFKKIHELHERQGIEAVVALTRQKNAEVISPPAGRSATWEYGFRIGHNSILYRLRTAYEKGGLQKLTSELQKQLEALGERQ